MALVIAQDTLDPYLLTLMANFKRKVYNDIKISKIKYADIQDLIHHSPLVRKLKALMQGRSTRGSIFLMREMPREESKNEEGEEPKTNQKEFLNALLKADSSENPHEQASINKIQVRPIIYSSQLPDPDPEVWDSIGGAYQTERYNELRQLERRYNKNLLRDPHRLVQRALPTANPAHGISLSPENEDNATFSINIERAYTNIFNLYTTYPEYEGFDDSVLFRFACLLNTRNCVSTFFQKNTLPIGASKPWKKLYTSRKYTREKKEINSGLLMNNLTDLPTRQPHRSKTMEKRFSRPVRAHSHASRSIPTKVQALFLRNRSIPHKNSPSDIEYRSKTMRNEYHELENRISMQLEPLQIDYTVFSTEIIELPEDVPYALPMLQITTEDVQIEGAENISHHPLKDFENKISKLHESHSLALSTEITPIPSIVIIRKNYSDYITQENSNESEFKHEKILRRMEANISELPISCQLRQLISTTNPSEIDFTISADVAHRNLFKSSRFSHHVFEHTESENHSPTEERRKNSIGIGEPEFRKVGKESMASNVSLSTEETGIYRSTLSSDPRSTLNDESEERCQIAACEKALKEREDYDRLNDESDELAIREESSGEGNSSKGSSHKSIEQINEETFVSGKPGDEKEHPHEASKSIITFESPIVTAMNIEKKPSQVRKGTKESRSYETCRSCTLI